ncbi:MAG: hypothetical protein J6B03_05090 [Candidatus Homeothermus sp.]|nr:hypothetical protein [Candidatus Homeothermus sp.]
MKKLLSTYLLNIIAAMALMMTAAACVDDTDLPEVAAPGTSVTIRIPNPAAADAFARSRAEADSPANAGTNVGASGSSPAAAASRAEEKDMDTEAKEGDIHSLWLLAYNTTNPDNNVIRQLQSSGQLTHEYSEYRIEFKPGTYRIYVVANLDEYITGEISASTEESYLEKLILNFSPDKLPNTTDGLPMACLPAQVDGATDGNITVEAGTTKTIQTDLTFLCAKVRYTILFDNSEGGFSREAFGSSTVTFNTASLTGVRKETPLTDAVNALDGAFEVDPIDLKVINDSKDLNDLADPGFNPSATGAQRAWQGTMYLPENLLTGARTILHLGATLDGNGAKLSYTVKLPKNGAETNVSPENTLTRGHFYDLVGRVTTIGDQIDITASVADWTLQTLTYALHGPYFLHVDKTEIKVTAGVETLLMYDTDAPTLGFESPKYGGTNLDLFQFKLIEQDGKKYISVTTNSAIPAETNNSFNSYFYIKAANLYKRIEVNPVSLEPFLNVSPTEIEINIAEYIASGDYDAEIPIEFTTNLPSVTITGYDGWDKSKIELEGEKSHTESQGTNTLKIKGFNSGIWTAEQSFQLTYTATNGTNTETETVKITVKPNQLDYLIHFRAPSNWTHPHIYVYQCLQIPQTRGDGYVGKTVGYYNDDSSDLFSALEYSFTGKIAFKGWDGTINNPKGDGTCETSTLGFFVFDDQEGWDPNRSGFDKRYYNNFDFCKLHRDSVSDKSVGGTKTECNACKNNPNKLWPGILMHDDGNGWWTFKLTGVATPGKALIMFNDQHSDNGRRYPALDENNKSQPGIPLFDYPSREGWFDLANFATQFSPSPNSVNRPQKVRIYWTKPADNNTYFYIWTDSNTGIATWDNKGKESEKYPSYLYSEFPVTSDMSFSTIFKYQLKQNNSVTKEIKISSFAKIDGGKTLVATLDENGNFENSGTPKEYGPEPALANNTYRIYWAKSTGWTYLWIWNCGNVNLTESKSINDTAYSMTGQYRGSDGVVYNYFDFTPINPNADNFWFNAKLKADPGNVWTHGSSDDLDIYKALFTNRKHKAI